MIFNYLKLTNFRPFYGEQTIYFHHSQNNSNSEQKRNIVLIGGLNGHGKTSLITAINIALFGHRYFNTQREYLEYISKSVNRRHIYEGGNEGSIELAFTDDTGRYAIKVDMIYNRLEEFRMAYELDDNFNKINQISLTDEEFNDFIDARIPLDVSRFFIFDAEKIRDLVGDQDKEDTRRAIQKVVSLELYHQLLIDLDKINKDFIKEMSGKTSDEEIEFMGEKIRKIAEEIEIIETKLNDIDAKINVLTSESREITHEKRKKIGKSNASKNQIYKWIGSYEQKLDQINNQLSKFKKDELYKIIIKPAIKSLQQRIRKELKYIEEKKKVELQFAPFEEFMSELLNTEIIPILTENQKQQLFKKGKEIWAEMNKIHRKIVSEQIELLHDLTLTERNYILNYSTSTISDLKVLLQSKKEAENLLKKYNEQLKDAPDDIDTSDLDQKLSKVNQELGMLKAESKNLNATKKSLMAERIRLSNELQRKLKDYGTVGPLQRKVDLVERLYNATNEFIEQVTFLKSRQLKEEIEKIIKQLFRKSDFEKIIFDENTFTLNIYDHFSEKIDLDSRSEGEKQLIALAMIWALTKVSGSNFPFVIDTPLARLDSDHRSNLVDYYFTQLSDQVIILSTDTEITEDFYKKLVPYIHKEYLLNYDVDKKFTTIEEGYYFSKEGSSWQS